MKAASRAAPLASWPYPRWIAHRGAGVLAPENTLAAFALGHACGFRMFECDVQLSADGELFLLHDERLERTTSGHGFARELGWPALRALDAGSWHGSAFVGEPLLTLAGLAMFCQAAGCALNVELKPAPGADEAIGAAAAILLQNCWHAALPPLLSSYSVAALAAARICAPQLPRALLLGSMDDKSIDTALELACVALVVEHHAVCSAQVRAAHEAGLALLCCTVNEAARALALLAWGVDGLITDAIDRFGDLAASAWKLPAAARFDGAAAAFQS